MMVNKFIQIVQRFNNYHYLNKNMTKNFNLNIEPFLENYDNIIFRQSPDSSDTGSGGGCDYVPYYTCAGVAAASALL